MELELGKRYQYEPMSGTITLAGMSEVQRLISAQRVREGQWKVLNPDFQGYALPDLPPTWEWKWLVLLGEWRGAFPKRIANYYFKAFGLKCLDTFIAEIGSVARRHSNESQVYEFEVVQEYDWRRGQFGDGGSCYWGSNAGAREMLRDNNAYAIRFYEEPGSQIGMARAWLVELRNGMFIIFNGYGIEGDPTLVIARIFSQFIGLSYRKIHLTNQHDTSGTLWIDGRGEGYLIGTESRIATVHSYDLGWTDYEINQCDNCGDSINDDETYYGADDMPYCERCYDRLFDSCQHCYELRWSENIQYVESVDEYICDYCIENDFTTCDECGDSFPNDQIRTHKDAPVCDECFEALKPQPKPKK